MSRFARLLIAVAIAVLALAPAGFAQGAGGPLNPLDFGKVGPTLNVPTPQSSNNGTPLLVPGEGPVLGPQMPPSPSAQSRCPPGYAEPADMTRMAHMVVCTVALPNYGKTYTGAPYTTQNYGKASYPGVGVGGISAAPMPTLERTTANLCAGRPGYYACGRGGTECCAANEDNPCFAGAYACSVPLGTPGMPKKACCIAH